MRRYRCRILRLWPAKFDVFSVPFRPCGGRGQTDFCPVDGRIFLFRNVSVIPAMEYWTNMEERRENRTSSRTAQGRKNYCLVVFGKDFFFRGFGVFGAHINRYS